MADTNVVVGASLKVDTGNTTQTVKEVRDSIKQYKAELDNATVGSEAHRAALQKLETANKSLNPTFKEQSSTLSAVNSHLSTALPAFGKASEGARGFGATLKALMANPIVLLIAAIVAGLKFLYDAFQHTFEGAQKITQVFAGVSKAVEVVVDRVFKLAGALVKFFTGDFKGAFHDAKAAVTGVGEEISNVYNKTVELTKKIQQLTREQDIDDFEKKKRETRLALLREDLNDENVSVQEKKKIAKELRDDQIQNAKDDLERITKLNTAKIALLKIGTDAEKKNMKEILGLQGEIEDTKRENALEGVRTNRVIRNLDRQEKTEDAAKEKEAEDKRKDALQKSREAERSRRENQRAYNDKLLTLQHENELNGIRDQTEKKLKAEEFSLQKENAVIEQDFKDKKITSDQRTALLQEVQKAYLSKVAQINDEHRTEEEKKQKEHDAALLKIQQDNAAKERDLILKEEALKVAMAKKKFDVQRQELNIKQQLINDQYAKELDAAKGNALRIREIELKHNEDSFQISQARVAISKAEKDAKLADADAVGSALTGLSNLIGQQTVVGKGLAVAQAIINTYTGATKALAQGGIAGIAGAAGVIAAGLASVQKIIATQVPGQSSGGSAPSVSSSSPLQPQPVQNSTTLDQDSINKIGNAASRVFVLDADIKNNRERIERINRAARL